MSDTVNLASDGKTIGFVGLGVMGGPMAKHLLTAGYKVQAYNRTKARAEKWHAGLGDLSRNAVLAETPKEAAAGADFVMACVGNDDDLRSVVYGDDGILSGLAAGTVFTDHSTVSATVAKEIAEKAAQQHIGFIDAPISGGEAGAVNGVLTIMCGGDQAVFDQVSPVYEAYGRTIRLLGDVGSGQLAKMSNQVAIAGVLQGLSEAILLAERSGLDVKAMLDVISQGAAGSWQMDNRGKTMNDRQFDFGFAVDWMRKDLGIVLDQAKTVGVGLPLTAQIDQFYSDVQALGGGRYDTSSLITRLDQFKKA